MSWPGHYPATTWNQAGLTVPDINSGSYTPEQWAMMQQQNWQQWSQWQQQYSQWQTHYGDKYGQQMQAVQSMGMGGIPPLPPTAVAPPPPPDKPPPPPPHENNQPLFNNQDQAPTSNQPPAQPRSKVNLNINSGTGNNQWSYSADTQQPAINSEALKKLAEEERLFDIQFQKWEEEIDKWRQENVNHPDKQAYKDYEAKFEACRKQLLERRQQMKMKRANLLNSATAYTAGNISVSQSISTNSNQNTSNQQPQIQNSQNKNYERKNFSHPQNPQQQNNKNVEPQDRFESYHQNVDANYAPHSNSPKSTQEDSSTFLQSSSSSKGIPGLDLVTESLSTKNPEVIDLSDDHANSKGPDYSTISMGINNILGDEKIMNILSMVQGINSNQKTDSNKISQSNNQGNQNFNQTQQYGHNLPNKAGQYQNQAMNSQYQQSNQGRNFNRPDSMQQDQYYDQTNQFGGSNHGRFGGPQGTVHSGIRPGMQQGGPNNRLGEPGMPVRLNFNQAGPGMNQGGPGINQGGPGMNQGGPVMNQSGPGMNQGGPGINQGGPGMNQGGPGMNQGGPGMNQGGPGMNQGGPVMNQGGPGMIHGGPGNQSGPGRNQVGPNMNQVRPGMNQASAGPRLNGPVMRPIRPGGPAIPQGQNMHQGGPNMGQGGPNMPQNRNMQPGTPNMQHGGPNMQGAPNMQKGSNMQQPPPLMSQRLSLPMQSNNGPGRQPLQDVSSQQNTEYYSPLNAVPPQPQKTKWVEDPMFTPSIVVEYEHKSLRLKARDFIEPVHTFDYNHISKDDEYKKKDFELEADEIFTRKPRRSERDFAEDRFRDPGSRDIYTRDYERRSIRDDFRDMPRDVRDTRDLREPRIMQDIREPRDFNDSKDFREREVFRDEMISRDRLRERDNFDSHREDRNVDRRRDELDRHGNRRIVNEDMRDRRGRRDDSRDGHRDERDRDGRRDEYRDGRKDEGRRDEHRDGRRYERTRSRSRDRDSRKRGSSRDSEASINSKKTKNVKDVQLNKPLVMIDDLLESPGREMRPAKIVVILRGLPGSGKSYLAKLIRDREAEHGGTARIMSIDDYFMQEGEIEETDPTTGKIIKKPSLKYEYDEASEETYTHSLKRAFKRSITDGYFPFLIYDAPNPTLHSYADIWNFARQHGFQVYICTMEQDINACFKRQIHNRKMEDLEVMASRFFPTPAHHIQLDPTTLLQSAAIEEVQMEDVEDVIMDESETKDEVESVFTSKWEKMDDANKLARLDGTSKPLRPSQLSMEEFLQLDDWTPNKAKPGKKTVRWADIEERREQEKMRAIGFVVGQTDWNRMTDPTMGSSALTQTKYIERVKR